MLNGLKAISFSLDLILKKASVGSGSVLGSFDGVCSVMHSIIPQPAVFLLCLITWNKKLAINNSDQVLFP